MSDSIDSVMVETESAEDEDELSFMKKLYSADWERYCFQKDLIRCRPPFCRPSIVYDLYKRHYDSYENQSFPIVKARDLDGGVKHYSFNELKRMTHYFKSTLICYTLFGTLHRGTIRTKSGYQDVLVKTWEYFYPVLSDDQDELNLLRDPVIRSHPNVVKLIGFHCERRLAVIYEDRHAELLQKIIPTGLLANPSYWDDRMKVATDIARMLGAFHDKGLVHGGVNSKYIMVDKEKCPVVFDFRLFSYCEDREEYEQYLRNHYDLHYKHLDGPPWSMKHDIFSYGILLLELIKKNLYINFEVPTWPNSAVDDSFCVDEYIAMGITELAINCLEVNSDEQPTMQSIFRGLKDLTLYVPPNKLQKISD